MPLNKTCFKILKANSSQTHYFYIFGFFPLKSQFLMARFILNLAKFYLTLRKRTKEQEIIIYYHAITIWIIILATIKKCPDKLNYLKFKEYFYVLQYRKTPFLVSGVDSFSNAIFYGIKNIYTLVKKSFL